MQALNHLKTTMLLGLMMALCMAVGRMVGGPHGMMLGLMFGGVGNLIAYFFSDKIAIATMRGKEIGRSDLPWLYDMVQRLSERAGLPMPRVYLCPQEAPNAFATGRGPRHAAVAVTQGMLERFPPKEIEGVLAHELGHVKHRDVLISTIAAILAGLISYAGYSLIFFGGGRSRDQNPLGAIGMLASILLAPLAAGLIQMAISRSREYAADAYSGELTGDPLQLASALQRLHGLNEQIPTDVNPAMNSMFIMEPLSAGRAFVSLFSTHPATEKRIAALREQAAMMR